MRKAIFFDAAGTLIRLTKSVGWHYALVARWQGLAFDPAALDYAFAQIWKEMPLRPATGEPREEPLLLVRRAGRALQPDHDRGRRPVRTTLRSWLIACSIGSARASLHSIATRSSKPLTDTLPRPVSGSFTRK